MIADVYFEIYVNHTSTANVIQCAGKVQCMVFIGVNSYHWLNIYLYRFATSGHVQLVESVVMPMKKVINVLHLRLCSTMSYSRLLSAIRGMFCNCYCYVL